jgi:hypothetical protein
MRKITNKIQLEWFFYYSKRKEHTGRQAWKGQRLRDSF